MLGFSVFSVRCQVCAGGHGRKPRELASNARHPILRMGDVRKIHIFVSLKHLSLPSC